MKTLLPIAAITASVCASAFAADQARKPVNQSAAWPAYCPAEHNVGGMALGVTNSGTFGDGYLMGSFDCFTGRLVRPCQFPIGSNTKYLYSANLWIGGIIGTDTLVSVGADGWVYSQELHPDVSPDGAMKYRSIYSTGAARIGAVSEQDFVAAYFDTCRVDCAGLITPDFLDGRAHRPLRIRVDQKTYAWSRRTVFNTTFFDLRITNIGDSTFHKMYLGVYVDGDVYASDYPTGYFDDISGYFSSVSDTTIECGFDRRIPTAWISDNDGELLDDHLVPNVTATALLNAPEDRGTVSFNWWVSNGDPRRDFGPTRKANHRDFGTGGTGTPVGDRNKYWMLGNGDIDYNQAMTPSIFPTDTIWEFPGWDTAFDLALGEDTRYLLSLGPVDLDPGQSVPFVFAYVGGRSFHTIEDNIQNLPQDPWTYEANLGFSDLKRSIKYASLVYDNPGVDTDTDGYSGTFVVCGLDTNWVTGDGVPDFRVAEPTECPQVWVTPQPGGAVIRWNGAATERNRWSVDGRLDFDGYNVYLKRKDDSAGFVKIAGYDVENFFKAAYDLSNNIWTLDPTAWTTDELRCMYAPAGCNDTIWHPTDFTRSHPMIFPGVHDSIFYFAPVGCNAHRFGYETPIMKTYPDAPKPRWVCASDVPPDSVSIYLTNDGWFKYYEYQLTFENLTPTDSYLVSVTALDFGKASLSEFIPLETSVDDGAIAFAPLETANCCVGLTGNIDCSPSGTIDIADLTALIDNLYISLSPLCCVGEANLDGDPEGVIDISDLTRLIDFLYISFATPGGCE
jgi:hypothetical protein